MNYELIRRWASSIGCGRRDRESSRMGNFAFFRPTPLCTLLLPSICSNLYYNHQLVY